jgi:small-conductance mechanosensitive channel
MAEHNGTLEAAAPAEGAGGWEAYALLVALLLLGIVAAWAVNRVALGIVRMLVRRTRTDLDDLMLDAVRRPLVVILSVVFALVLVRLDWVVRRVPPEAVAAFERFQVALLVLAGAYAVVRIIRGMLRRPGTRFARVRAVGNLVSRLVAISVYTIAFLTVLSQYGISITPILTSLGIAGLAVALALQDTLANFFAGMWIQTGRAMRPGHYIRLEDLKLEGHVVDVGWRTTLIKTTSNNVVVVPNAKLAQSIVTDHNLPDLTVSATLAFTLPLDTDPQAVERMLTEEVQAARAEAPALLDTPPIVRLNGFGEYGLQFLLIFFVTTFNDQFAVQDVLRRRALARFRAEGLEMPVPVREVRVTHAAAPQPGPGSPGAGLGLP